MAGGQAGGWCPALSSALSSGFALRGCRALLLLRLLALASSETFWVEIASGERRHSQTDGVQWAGAVDGRTDGVFLSFPPSLPPLASSRRSFTSLKRSNHPKLSEPQTHQTSRCTSTHRLTVRSDELPVVQLSIVAHYLFSLPFQQFATRTVKFAEVYFAVGENIFRVIQQIQQATSKLCLAYAILHNYLDV